MGRRQRKQGEGAPGNTETQTPQEEYSMPTSLCALASQRRWAQLACVRGMTQADSWLAAGNFTAGWHHQQLTVLCLWTIFPEADQKEENGLNASEIPRQFSLSLAQKTFFQAMDVEPKYFFF